MYRIDLRNLVKNKLYICKEYHIQPSELDILPFYEYEWILEEINILQKDQEEQNKSQQDEYDNMKSSMNFGKMMNSMKNNIPNYSNASSSLGKSMSMPNISTPSINIPKVNIPSI